MINFEKVIEARHPCFSEKAHFKWGRIHLPVAPRCNMQCLYCERAVGCSDERPGVAKEILSPQKALVVMANMMKKYPLSVVAVAGPGEPLANEETFIVLKKAKEEFPGLIRCLSTNGLAVCEKLEVLRDMGLNTLTVTVNAVNPKIGAQIYEYVDFQGKRYFGEEAAGILLNNQLKGIKRAASAGILVKINSVYIPGINGEHLVEVARRCKEAGAKIMNIMPLIPVGRFKEKQPPTTAELSNIRTACGVYLKQFTKCRQCRADACGIPGIDGGRGYELMGSADWRV